MEFTDYSDFLDVRRHGFFRVAVISPPVRLGNPEANAKVYMEWIKKVYEESGAMYVLAPEMGLVGYSLGDLHLSEVVIEGAKNALHYLVERTRSKNMIVSVGLPLQFGHFLVNALVTFCQGNILEVKVKEYLPNEGEFYEERHWAVSAQLPFNEINLFGQSVPVGTKTLIACDAHPGVVFYTTICESDWTPVPTSGFAALAGATIIANSSASNITIGKDEYREQQFVGASGRYQSAYLYASAGFGESTSDLAWDGHIFIAERGNMIVQGSRFSPDGDYIVADIDVCALISERRRQHSFRENCRSWKNTLAEFRIVRVPELLGLPAGKSSYNRIERSNLLSHPFVPIVPDQRRKRCGEVFEYQTTSLMRRLLSLPEESRKIVLGVSGGSDSTHALLVAAATMDRLKLSRTNIIGVTMPGYGTTVETKSDAHLILDALGVTKKEISIIPSCDQMLSNVGLKPGSGGDSEEGLAYENTQAWTRAQILLAIAAKERGIVLGTGDLSELLIGWCTLFGDHPLHYSINAGVAKTLILYLIGYAREMVFKDDKVLGEALDRIRTRPISPELLPPTESGEMAQLSENINGPYELHEFFGYYMVRFGFAPSHIFRRAVQVFEGKYDTEEIRKWFRLFLMKFFNNQFKRNIMADGPKIGLVSLSPRGDWRMPSDAEAQAWLDDLAACPNSDGGIML